LTPILRHLLTIVGFEIAVMGLMKGDKDRHDLTET
jgi:hypothetical protein